MPGELHADPGPDEGRTVGGAVGLLARTLAAAVLGGYAAAASVFLLRNAGGFIAAEQWALRKFGDAVRQPEAGLPAAAGALVLGCIVAAVLVFVEHRFNVLRTIRQHLRVTMSSCRWAGGFWSKIWCVLVVLYVVVVSVVVIVVSVLVAVVIFLNLLALSTILG
jgi:hypothetical protein